MNQQIDQREFIRVPDCSDVVYQTASGKKKKSETKDISQTGICFFTEEKPKVDDVIDVILTLERLEYSFAAKASVRWVNEIIKNRRYEVGVKFVDLPEQDIKGLLNYINSVIKLDRYR
jgi:c-di-GMP-binding flagellar brake protein YcgR